MSAGMVAFSAHAPCWSLGFMRDATFLCTSSLIDSGLLYLPKWSTPSSSFKVNHRNGLNTKEVESPTRLQGFFLMVLLLVLYAYTRVGTVCYNKLLCCWLRDTWLAKIQVCDAWYWRPSYSFRAKTYSIHSPQPSERVLMHSMVETLKLFCTSLWIGVC